MTSIRFHLNTIQIILDKMKLFTPANRGIDVNKIIDLIYKSIEMIDNEEKFNWDILPQLKIIS